MNTAVFLQVRLNSNRLPRKALRRIKDRTVIEHAMISLKQLKIKNHVIVTASGDEKELSPLAENCGFETFVGDRDDVLQRYLDAAEYYNPDCIIRATGDNPLVAWEMAELVLTEFEKRSDTDYMAMRGLPIGCGVEVFKTEALSKAAARTKNHYDHEHVTPYIYNNPDQFKLEYMDHDPALNNRVTLDTEKDFLKINGIFNQLHHGDKPISFNDLKEYLLTNDKS